ncbi:hypothetical protein ACEPPN_017968 [Leptodophora sp. 'Broadleaf-Isolate-01']
MSMLRAVPHDTHQLQIQRLMTTFIEDKEAHQSQSEVTVMVKQSKAQRKQRGIFLCPKMPWRDIPRFGTRIAIYMSQAENRTCQFVAGETDFEFVGSRIEECISSHENCQDPDIDFWQFDTSRFVDVGERKIVLFDTSTPPDYIALSYVWGSVKQISYSLNTTLPRLPQTIEDAMIVVRQLGKRYLWVDSLCIDQTNDEHKQSQIMIMHEIYHNSWAIIVDLSGTSANSGLSRIHTDWFPRQLRHEIDGHQFVSGLPHLLAYAKQSPWSERGWVLQEAMLSRRCIIFTRSQVYYECNEWQFSETFPTVVVDPPFREKPFKERRQFSTGVFRMTGNQSLRSTEQRLHMYSQLLVDYKKRKITYPSDSLNAFSAILFDLIGKIKSHFSNGLPIEYMPWALGWKQKCMGPMRSDFPSRLWAAWDGPLSTGAIEPINSYYSGAEGFQPYFTVVATDQWNQPSTYTRNVDQRHRWGGTGGTEDIKNLKIRNMQFEDLVGETTKPSQTALQITGVVFKLVVHIPEQPSKGLGRVTICHVYIENEELDVYVTPSKSPSELCVRFRGDAQDFLMLARADSVQTDYEFLLLEWRDGIAYRLDAVVMRVHRDDLKLIGSLKPVLKRFWLG